MKKLPFVVEMGRERKCLTQDVSQTVSSISCVPRTSIRWKLCSLSRPCPESNMHQSPLVSSRRVIPLPATGLWVFEMEGGISPTVVNCGCSKISKILPSTHLPADPSPPLARVAGTPCLTKGASVSFPPTCKCLQGIS